MKKKNNNNLYTTISLAIDLRNSAKLGVFRMVMLQGPYVSPHCSVLFCTAVGFKQLAPSALTSFASSSVVPFCHSRLARWIFPSIHRPRCCLRSITSSIAAPGKSRALYIFRQLGGIPASEANRSRRSTSTATSRENNERSASPAFRPPIMHRYPRQTSLLSTSRSRMSSRMYGREPWPRRPCSRPTARSLYVPTRRQTV